MGREVKQIIAQRLVEAGFNWDFTVEKKNPVTGVKFEGVNLALLSNKQDKFFITYKQALSIGAKVKKGEKGTPIVGRWIKGEPKQYYVVFGLSQVEGLTDDILANLACANAPVKEVKQIAAPDIEVKRKTAKEVKRKEPKEKESKTGYKKGKYKTMRIAGNPRRKGAVIVEGYIFGDKFGAHKEKNVKGYTITDIPTGYTICKVKSLKDVMPEIEKIFEENKEYYKNMQENGDYERMVKELNEAEVIKEIDN
jgi:hypothetical protein